MPGDIPQESPVPNVEPAALPTPYDQTQASPENFGGGAALGAQQAGSDAEQIADRARAIANKSADDTARGAGETLLTNQIISDVPGSGGFRSLNGHDAQNAAQPTIEEFNKGIDKIAAGLQPGAQQLAFAPYALSLKSEAARYVNRHLAGQVQVISAVGYKTATAATIGKLGSLDTVMDPAERATNLSRLSDNTIKQAQLVLGQSATSEEIDNFVAPVMQNAVMTALETFKANSDKPGVMDEAKKFLESESGLLGKARTQLIAGQIYRRDDTNKGLKAAQDIARQNTIQDTSIINDGAVNALSNMGLSPEVQKIAEQELQRRAVTGRQMQKQSNEGAFTAGVTSIRKNDQGGLQDALDSLSVPGGGGGEFQAALMALRDKHAKEDARSPAVLRQQADALDAASTLLASTRASDTTLDAFMSQPVGENPDGSPGPRLAATLSLSGHAKIAKAFMDQQRRESTDKPLDGQSMGQVMTTLKDALGYPVGNSKIAPSDRMIAERNHVVDYVRQQRNAWQEANPGKTPGAEDYQGWINDQVGKVEGTSPKGFFNLFASDKRRVDIDLDARQGAPPVPVAQSSVAAASPAATPAAVLPPLPGTAGAPPVPAQHAAAAPPPGQVRVLSKTGVFRYVPAAQLDAFIAGGATLAQ
jgi:hypothetical protein